MDGYFWSQVLAETQRERQAVEKLHQTSVNETRRYALSQRHTFGSTDLKGPIRPHQEHYTEPYIAKLHEEQHVSFETRNMHVGVTTTSYRNTESDTERQNQRRSISPLMSESSTPEADAYRRVAPVPQKQAKANHKQPPAYHQVVQSPPSYSAHLNSPTKLRAHIGSPTSTKSRNGNCNSGTFGSHSSGSSSKTLIPRAQDYSDYHSSIETLTEVNRSYSQSSIGSSGSQGSTSNHRPAPAPPRRRSSLNNDVHELRKSHYEARQSGVFTHEDASRVVQSDTEQASQRSKVTGMAKFTVSRTSPEYSKVRSNHGVNMNIPLQLAAGSSKPGKNFVIQSSRC